MPDTELNQPYWEIIDCDLLFIVVSSNQELSNTEQEFIQNFDRTLMAKQFLVVEIADAQEENQESHRNICHPVYARQIGLCQSLRLW